MSWLSSYLKKGFSFSWTFGWFGEKNLPPANQYPKTVTKEEVEKEIRDSLNKQKGAER